jgi:hypothetical protein
MAFITSTAVNFRGANTFTQTSGLIGRNDRLGSRVGFRRTFERQLFHQIHIVAVPHTERFDVGF